MPGTNLYASRGDNPLWDPDEEQKPNGLNKKANPVYKTDDREFEATDSSSDDEFVGVEDQDDFKGYKDRYDVSLANWFVLNNGNIKTIPF